VLLDADTDVFELADVALDDVVEPDDVLELDEVVDVGVEVTAAAAVVVAAAWWVRLIVASVAPNSSAALAIRAAAVRRGERPGRTRRFGTRALRMEIAPEGRWMRPWCRAAVGRR